MSSIRFLFYLQVLVIIYLEVLDFLIFILLSILEWFLNILFRHVIIIPISNYVQINHRWLNLVTHIGKFVYFLLPIRVVYVSFFLNTNPFIFMHK